MALGAVQIQVDAKAFRQAIKDIPHIVSPLIRGEMKRAGKRAEKDSKKESLAGRPGIRLPRSGRPIAKTKAQKGYIKSLTWGDFEQDAMFVLVLKGSRFLKWHQLEGKTFDFEQPLARQVPDLNKKVDGAITRAWQIAADRNASQRFRI